MHPTDTPALLSLGFAAQILLGNVFVTARAYRRRCCKAADAIARRIPGSGARKRCAFRRAIHSSLRGPFRRPSINSQLAGKHEGALLLGAVSPAQEEIVALPGATFSTGCAASLFIEEIEIKMKMPREKSFPSP